MAWLEECLTPLWGHLDSNTTQKWLGVVKDTKFSEMQEGWKESR